MTTSSTDADRGALRMEKALAQLIFVQLRRLGLLADATLSLEEQKRRLQPLYGRWLEESVRVLVRHGHLRGEGGGYTVVDAPDAGAAWEAWEAAKSEQLKDPELHAQVKLLDAMVSALPDILVGKRLATDVLFADASMEHVGDVYRGSTYVDHFNAVVAEGVLAYVEDQLERAREAGGDVEPIRILEIGAGTGGTSAIVFDRLKPHTRSIEEYCYTDISKAFLLHAEQRYRARAPYLKCRLLNIENPPEEQGFGGGTYDVVIATNVLHATRSIRTTLRNTKVLLRRNGLIFLNEMSNTKSDLFTHLTFGLTKGWWLFEDDELRVPGTPALLPQTWRKVLEAEGFGDVCFPAEADHASGHQVIVAQSDGVVRQPVGPRGKPRGSAQARVTEPEPAASSVDEQALLAHVQQRLLERVCESLQLEDSEVDFDVALADYGMDSIIGIKFVKAVNESLSIDLETTVIFDYSSLSQLAGHILSRYRDRLTGAPSTGAGAPARPERLAGAEPKRPATAAPRARASSPGGAVTEQALRARVQQRLLERVCESLQLEAGEVDFDVALADYGMDSIIGIKFVKAVNESLSIELETTVIFDYSSLSQLADHIVSRYREVLAAPPSADTAEPVAAEAPVAAGAPVAAEAPVAGARLAPAGGKGPIAIIGVSGRFARSRDLEELWEHLARGDDLIETAANAAYPYGSFLQGIDEFDPLFFNISGVEATYMDPKQRIFLEEAWKALEDAGYAGVNLEGRLCGVYVGCEPGDYKYLFGGSAPAQAMWGNANSVLPARVSYYLDLQGPAIAVDTACSSSLVAAHLACQALWGRETDIALAGGVSLGCMPDSYGGPAAAGMLSPTGRCHTFDARADGFVPGEGAGAVVLKRLEDAIADDDRIHGVIRASGINQDGATNGITAPSARSQERLERRVYETFGVDPARIEMVEAHGTGTVLGDPIEFSALTRAFREHTDKKQYCAIGSIKTNLGHALAASGMAGLFKILLSFKHRKIPPSLHYREGNAHIDFTNSPFFVNTTLKEWPARRDADGAPLPRCAAISAFGMSGTNAHMVLESYEPRPDERPRETGAPYHLLALSAKTEAALQRRARDLVDLLLDERRAWDGQALSALSYTLLAYRPHFEHRSAVVAADREEAIASLERVAAGGEHPAVARGFVARGFAAQPALVQDAHERLERLASERHDPNRCRTSLAAIAELYCQGYSLDWSLQYGGRPPRRIALPAYPFARERYWVEVAGGDASHRWFTSPSTALHPLAQRNTSTLGQQRFSTTLSGDEFFLRDHRVQGKPVVPGVVYLEMARAAVMVWRETEHQGSARLHLKGVVWRRPLVVSAPEEVHVRLRAAGDAEIDFEISTVSPVDAETVVHVQGRAVLTDERTSASIDVEALRATCTRLVPIERFYALGDSSGVALGPAHRSVTSMHVGVDVEGRRCVLAEVTLPDCVAKGSRSYVLHPSVLDGALQASIGIALAETDLGGEHASVRPLLPFALEILEILDRSPSKAIVRVQASATGATRDLRRLDVDICDEAGKVCVRMRNFTFRSLEGAPESPALPVLRRSAATAEGESFVGQLSGDEFFLRDHDQLLPGVVHLEMARASAAMSRGRSVSAIKNVVWLDVLRVSAGARTLQIALSAEPDATTFKVIAGDALTPTKVFAQGTVLFDRGSEAPRVDLDALRARCTKKLDGVECDRIIGAAHGPSMRPIEWLSHDDREGLARLTLPAGLGEANVGCVLHPSVMHGAVTAAIALGMIQDGRPSQLRFPYALEQVWIHSRTPDVAYVYVRESADSRGEKVRKYDLDIVDESGRCAVALRGFTAVAADVARPRSGAEQIVYAAPSWETRALPAQADAAAVREPPVFVLATPDVELAGALKARWTGATVEELRAIGSDRAADIEANFLRVLELVKRRIQGTPRRVQPFCVLVEDSADAYVHGAFAGLLKTARMECSNLLCKVVRHAPGSATREALLDRLRAELDGASDEVEIRYRNGAREARSLRELTLDVHRGAAEAVRAGSVVWITGGLGGLGRILARHFGATPGVTIVLSGRSEPQGSARDALDALREQGIDAHHRVCDVSHRRQVRELVEGIQQRWGRLSGIIHCAGVTRDAYLVDKTVEDARAVLAPKVAGVLALDDATRDVALDFLVLFSSLSSGGNPGQGDYAGANSFLDEFAHHRNERVARGERSGHTLSMNWPLWREGGMHVGSATQELNERVLGLRGLDTRAGLQALVAALVEKHTQVLVAPGEPEKVRAMLLRAPTRPATPSAPAPRSVAAAPAERAQDRPALDRVVQELVAAASTLLKLDVRSIDPRLEFSRFGFDSIMFTEFTNHLNKHYGLELMPTVFFERSTIELLGEYLVEHHERQLRAKWGTRRPAPARAPRNAGDEQLDRRDSLAESRGEAAARAREPAHAEREPIAVVGMSGRFPGSASVRELWENVAQNRDLIREVPADRWDWRELYGDPRTDPGKTRVTSAGFMADVDCFDPLFFGISPAQAEAMDPQHRLLLEAVWACIEDAGHAPSSLSGSRIGVFIGISTLDYKSLLERSHGTGAIQGLFHFMVANRVSYVLNLHGPSEPIDTACSSSLVAIHRAVRCLRSGECDAALVGGVNVIASPEITLGASQAGMLSEDGRCKSFDRSADGYGRGEGVAALFLKPLARAEADGDHVYGLIRGSAENHGGKATSPTAPNPLAQQQLIVAAYDDAGVDVRTVGYIEAHGTGTALGDPVELNGLKGAFAQLYAARGSEAAAEPHCGVGSLKTNIGHLEAAAGIAGVIKVLMMLRYGEIPGNVHLKEPNPYIRLEGSPFYLVRETRDWPELRDREGRAAPRRAGVSSFGVGGANAHVVLEQYVAPAREASRAPAEERPALIVLSARDDDRLREQARQLLREVADRPYTDGDLTDIAHTLQLGRDAMEHRLAFTAVSVAQLRERLSAFLEGKAAAFGLHHGAAKRNKESLSSLAGDEDFAETVDRWIQRGKYGQVLELWVKGVNIDWRRLHCSDDARRVSLPTYPFVRERYWVEATAGGPSAATTAGAVLHPLVQRNTSDLGGLRFSADFSGDEPFLRDHVVRGQKVLPAVAYLEMAREAVTQSLGDAVPDGAGLEMRDVVWLRPLAVGEGLSAHVRLHPEGDTEIRFEVYTRPSNGSEADVTVHAEGRVLLMDAASTTAERMDLAALATMATQSIGVEAVHEAIAAAGIEFGPAHRGLSRLHVGARPDGEPFVLARVEMPASVRETASEYHLHPSVLDGALQASIGLASAGDEARADGAASRLSLPFALEKMVIFDRTPAVTIVCVRPSDGAAEGNVTRTDIDVCDESGRVCVRLKGFTSRVVEAEPAESDISLFRPEWESADAAAEPRPAYGERWVCVDESYREQVAALRSRHPEVSWDILLRTREDDDDEWCAEPLMTMSEQLLARVRGLLAANPSRPVLTQVVVNEASGGGALRAIGGLLRSARLENPLFHGQVIGLPAQAPAELLEQALAASARRAATGDTEVRHAAGRREILSLKPVPESRSAVTTLPWKTGGVYLITGGAGALGRLFAKEIASRVDDARLVLVGRSSPSSELDEQIRELAQEGRGTQVRYRAVDVANAAAAQSCVDWIRAQYGRLDGVIHSAGLIRDSFLIKKTAEELRAVLGPKVLGAVNLDRATRDSALDFLVLFSSGAGATGNVGQSDYATANAFLDRFAAHRNELVKQGRRRGRTLSISWPLWAEGAMSAGEATLEAMRRRGLVPLSSAAGIEAFYRAWRTGEPQVVVVAGQLEAEEAPVARAAEPIVVEAAWEGADLRQGAVLYLKRLLATALKMPLDRIDPAADLEQYGFDSILALRMVSELEASFGPLPRTLMFQYRNIDALAEHFLASHGDALRSKLTSTRPVAASSTPIRRAEASKALPLATAKPPRERASSPALRPSRARETAALDIAIIGVAGRYPQARNVQEYWANLKAGKDCITEIPAARWDHGEHYDPQKGKLGKTYSKWGGFIDGVDEFDPLFFNISPQEATYIDPQERLFLQCVYQTLEDAGYTREALVRGRGPDRAGDVGVFVGVMYEEYQLYGAQAQIVGQPYALPGSPASIANRVSYFCNFHGPSMAVDTMCSSSLTAIHLACESLQRGECEVAIAGGVNVSVHPNKYLMLAQGQFVSTDGRCKSFGQGGDGYVPGEGVGAVLLKRLERAVADRDHIYGVIKATRVNHGGKTNGYTVPNPAAQAQVIARALEQSRVNPRAISYIEAHGTGTSLGDPIEISGLTQAFAPFTNDTQFCAIGSAKSNIGHLESAAGIAALTKVLLQMQHRTLAPSLHAEVLNPHIDFTRTPFRVQQTCEEWKRPTIEVEGVQSEHPRTAGISSFGAGGSNAHLIVAEYSAEGASEPASVAVTSERPALIVLSARTEERLQARAKQLLDGLRSDAYAEGDLGRIAYTLQTGRDALEVRLAFTAVTLDELRAKLTGFVEGKAASGEIPDCYVGHAKQQREALAAFTADEDIQEAIRKWVARGKYSRLLELWVKGFSFSWSSLYDSTPGRISLPAYPFSAERYWIETPARKDRGAVTGAALHPLLHANTSRLSGQRFSSTFTGGEFFFADHVVQGRRILPGVAALEMALTAAERSVDAPAERSIVIRDAAWLQPIAIGDEALTVHLALYPREAGELEYSIYSGEGEGERNVYARGRVAIEPTSVASVTDVSALEARCSRRIPGAQCYELFDALGIAYGTSFRAIDCVYAGEGEALAKLRLPEPLARAAGDYVLHPSLMDAAIQASIGAVLSEPDDAKETPKPTLLFALDSLTVLQRCTEQAWAWIRRTESTEGTIRKLDVDLYTGQGTLCARLRGLAFRVLSDAARSSTARGDARPADGASGELMLAPRWEAAYAPGSHAWPEAGDSVVWIGMGSTERRALEQRYPSGRALDIPAAETAQGIAERLSAAGSLSHVFWMAPRAERDEPHAAVVSGLRLLQGLLRAGYAEKDLGLTVVTRQAHGIGRVESGDPEQAAVHGLVGSVAKEQPRWRIRMVDVSEEGAWPLDEILTMPADHRGNAWAHRGGEWYREQWLPCERAQQDVPSRFRRGGVYVVLGGAGRLGEALSEYLIRTYGARMVWIGRRALDADIEAKLDRLGRLGPAPMYVSADAADVEALARAYRQIKARHGAIHGLIHSTLVMSGSDVAHMDEQRFAAGLGAKADVSAGMARVFAEEPLDFVLFYSSIESFERSPRQSNYAAGSVFNDAFARRLSKEWARPVKIMNWGYWGGGPIPDALQNWLDEAGFALIEPDRAMSAIEDLLAGPFTQLAFVRTTRARALKGIELGNERVQHVATSLPPLAQVLASQARALRRPREPTPASSPLR
ncbi:SDR family NAD(P)-dependent oxidoreductase [Sorangium sp. So ce1153]|uniref:SDR family NAD(P)-dependent oxidoreductase n=1 Tax=Sorangium sp. So ce1153 TaxID=3133333 RepID=UPI003F5F7A5D